MKWYFTNVLLIAMAIAFLWHFSNIVRFGFHYIREPNPFILYSEIALFVAIIGFGVYNLAKRKRR